MSLFLSFLLSKINNFRGLDSSERRETLVDIKTMQKGMDFFADEILIKIFSFLSGKDLLSIGLVNRRFGVLSNDKQLWQLLCISLGINHQQELENPKSSYFYYLNNPKKIASRSFEFSIRSFLDFHQKNIIISNFEHVALLDLKSLTMVRPLLGRYRIAVNSDYIFRYLNKEIFICKKKDLVSTKTEIMANLVTLEDSISALAVNDNYMVTGSVNGMVKVWKPLSLTTSRAECLRRFTLGNDKIEKVVVENNFVAAISLKRLGVMNIDTGKMIIEQHMVWGPSYLYLDIKNAQLFIGKRYGGVEILDCKSPREDTDSINEGDKKIIITQYSTPLGGGAASEILYTAFLKGSIVITNEMGTVIRFWDIKTKNCLYTFCLDSGFSKGGSNVDFSDSKVYHVYDTPHIRAIFLQENKIYLSITSKKANEFAEIEEQTRLEVWTLPREITNLLNS